MENNELVHRAVQWHRGLLPPNEQLDFFDIHVLGPRIHGGVDRPTKFHTYACLYPERGLYLVYNTGEWEGLAVSGQQVRRIVAELRPSAEKIAEQRQVARQYRIGTAALRWLHACATATVLNLPVAMMMIGYTAESDELVVYQRSAATAPLAKVASEFKRAVLVNSD